MNETENFESLRRLLSLKRHEIPPPGYFNNFSRDVIARIKTGETGEPAGGLSWLRQLWETFETKPIFAGAFGAAVCGLLISAAMSPEDNAASMPAQMGGVAVVAAPETARSSATQPSQMLAAFDQASGHSQAVSSTNAAEPSLNSLFDQAQIHAQPVSFGFSGN